MIHSRGTDSVYKEFKTMEIIRQASVILMYIELYEWDNDLTSFIRK